MFSSLRNMRQRAARERGRDSTKGVLCHGSSIFDYVFCFDGKDLVWD